MLSESNSVPLSGESGCRSCSSRSLVQILDLGHAPPSNRYISADDNHTAEVYFPLVVMVCQNCWLVQTKDFLLPEELFTSDYAYFSSASQTWLDHSKALFNQVREKFGFDQSSFVIEVASNDGYLLRHFVEEGIPCLGIEPSKAVAQAAKAIGVETLEAFFGSETAVSVSRSHGCADLLIANNVLAHVPDINDFVGGICKVIGPQGIAVIEFPHLLSLLGGNQFDTVYHEHFSYISLLSLMSLVANHDLRVFDVETIPTHGGSLRVFLAKSSSNYPESPAVASLLDKELGARLDNVSGYSGLQQHAEQAKDDLLSFLLAQKAAGKTVVAYGAAAKGNTLLNFAGIKKDLISAVFDASPGKQSKLLPGSRIPILDPQEIAAYEPDVVLILPWNIAEEIRGVVTQKLSHKPLIVTAIPTLQFH